METSTQQPRRNARYHTVQTAAARLECSVETVKKWCQDPEKRQRLGAFKPDGHWRIPFTHFEQMIEQAQVTGSMF